MQRHADFTQALVAAAANGWIEVRRFVADPRQKPSHDRMPPKCLSTRITARQLSLREQRVYLSMADAVQPHRLSAAA